MSSDIAEFQKCLKRAKYVALLTGAGVSAESGIPTFRGEGGLWRRYSAMDLASPTAWKRDPGLVWEFYNYRRTIVRDKKPNPAHFAIARLETRIQKQGRFHLITQNIDDLHFAAGSKEVTRLHGSLWQVRCVECGKIMENRDVPITPAFAGSGSPDPSAITKKFGGEDLPHCKCGGILRPNVVWFGESLDPRDLERAYEAAQSCDVFIVVGTSLQVYPAAGLVPVAKSAGATLALVDLEIPSHAPVDFFFQGKAGEVMSQLVDY